MGWSQWHFRRFMFWVALKSRIQSRNNDIEVVRKYLVLVSFCDVPKNSKVADIFSAKCACLYVICPLFALCMDLKVDWSFSGPDMGDFPWHFSTCVVCGVSLAFGWALCRLIWHWILFKAPALLSEKMMVLQLGRVESQDTLAQINEETDMAWVICGSDLPGWKSQHRVNAVQWWGKQWVFWGNLTTLVLAMEKVEPGRAISHLCFLSIHCYPKSS